MKSFCYFVCISCLLTAGAFSADLAFVQFESDSYDVTEGLLQELEAKGVTARHIFPPNQAIVAVHGLQIDRLDDTANRWTVATAAAKLKAPLAENRPWQAYLHLVSKSDQSESREPVGFHGCLGGSETWEDSSKQLSRTASYHKMESQYLIGSVAIGIYLIESTGPMQTEDWWPAAEQTTFNEIVEGLDWLVAEGFARGAKVRFVYAPMETVNLPVVYPEPISDVHRPYYNDGDLQFGWLDPVFVAHGVSTEWDGAYALANQLRQYYHTNWACEFMVVMDQNDPDHMFADNYFAYVPADGNRCGPFVVMTYNNDGHTPSGMSGVAAHELSHVFGTSDEYNVDSERPPHCHEMDDCGAQWSFLQTDNGNCEKCNLESVGCYMRREHGLMCTYTPPELGWRDQYLAGNDVMDPVDQNSWIFATIGPVAPGDIIRVFNWTASEFYNVFVVTSDQLFGVNNNLVLWDGIDYQNYCVLNGT